MGWHPLRPPPEPLQPPAQVRMGSEPSLRPWAAIQTPCPAGGSVLGGPRVGTPTGSQKSYNPAILPALLTRRGAPTWGPLGDHDGSWAGPGDSNECPRPAHSLPSSNTPLGASPRPLSRVPWLGRAGWSLPLALSLHQQSPVTLGLRRLSLWLYRLGALDTTTQPAPPPTNPQTDMRADTSCKPGAHLWQSAAQLGETQESGALTKDMQWGLPGRRTRKAACKCPQGSLHLSARLAEVTGVWGWLSVEPEDGQGWVRGLASSSWVPWDGDTSTQWQEEEKGKAAGKQHQPGQEFTRVGVGWGKRAGVGQRSGLALRTTRQAPAPGPAFSSSPSPTRPRCSLS